MGVVQVIQRDVLAKKYKLNERQTNAVEYLLEYGKLTIHNFEELCPKINRRTLQRDLKNLLEDKKINKRNRKRINRSYALLRVSRAMTSCDTEV